MIKFNTMKAKLADGFPALTYKNFRYFWIGQCVSLMGTWMQRTAQQWLVYNLTNSPLLLGLLGVFQFAPVLVFSLFAGVYVDRFPKKTLLIITQAVFMIQAFILAFLVWSGHVQYWHILVLAGVLGIVNTFDMPIRQSFFSELVEKKDLVNAIALNSAIVNVARIIGPALSGLLIVYFGAAFCFLLNGVSFIAVLIGLIMIKPIHKIIVSKKGQVLSDIRDGLKYVRNNKIIFDAIFSMLIVGTFAMNMDVIIPVFAKDILHKGADGYSFLLSAMGFGSLIGALLLAVKVKSNPSKKMLYISAILLSALLMIQGFVYGFSISMVMLTVIGFFNICFMTIANSTVQLNSSDEYRGRTISVYSLVFAGTTPFGNMFAGGVTEKLGPNMGFLWCGGATFIFLMVLFVFNRSKNLKKSDCIV